MSSRIHRNMGLMALLFKANPSMRKLIISKAAPDFINALCEVALNVLKGNIPLTTKQYKILQKKKSVIRVVADKKVRPLKKRDYKPTRCFFIPTLGGRYSIFNIPTE